MGDPKGFLKVARVKEGERPVDERIRDWTELTLHASDEQVRTQASRCMECGIPFCHSGCPLGNLIPEWNDLVYRGKLGQAVRRLHSTNNFPEVTGRVCPAPCEASCVLNIREENVTIKTIERTIADHGMESGESLRPRPAKRKSGRRVAVIGSGPAGLACAQQLARAGHAVVLFERDDRIGGLLRYGIPDFKLWKSVIDQRMVQMQTEGVVFRPSVAVGVDLRGDDLRREFDAVVLAMGARAPRDLPIPGRNLQGVHFAMDFLTQQNRRVAGDSLDERAAILATGKHVVVIGGGDTGSDCVGTSIRQGAASVTQIELMPKPPLSRMPSNPWPEWPQIMRTSSSQAEGAERDWAVSTRAFRGASGRVTGLDAMRVAFEGRKMVPIAGSEFCLPCELVLLAMGFTGPESGGIIDQLGVELNERGNVKTAADGSTSAPGVFAAGDVARGQSLVVWAIAEGRRVADGVGLWLDRNRVAVAANG
jgi:glutamate synthase (NADPH/NADH) small chain